jgi:hypothetical protein
MRPRRKALPNSLELLLDTICNTFGGVLFLAILVSLMLRLSSPLREDVPTVEALQKEMLALESQQEDVFARLETLRLAAASQETMVDRFTTPDIAQLLAEYHERRARRDRLMSERAILLRQIAKGQLKTSRLAEKVKELDRALASAVAEKSEAEVALRSELGWRAQAARLPRVRSTFKREVGLIVRYGRAYFWHRYDRSGKRLGLNTDDFVIVEDRGSHVETAPKPYAGYPIKEADAQVALANRLRDFDKHTSYLALVVWEDSFEVFQTLKKLVVDLGFEYRLMPTPFGESIMDRGGRGSHVQ